MEKGLYFYKLESPYPEDVTKNCKLSINEIDHNFLTLKDMDVKEATFDKDDKTLVITRNNGEELNVDLSELVTDISDLGVDYEPEEGTITIIFNGKKIVINGLITNENLSSEIMTEVISDSTLKGKGTDGKPLGISPVEKTNSYKSAIRFIDLTEKECMPKPRQLKKGDRYLTYEKVSEYGYLYNFNSVKKINDDLKNGWRVPTKEDWDNMLNAIEPCAEYRNHNSINGNQMLGKLAGKLLKSVDKWDESDSCFPYEPNMGQGCGCGDDCDCQCKKPEDCSFDPDFDEVCGKIPPCRPPKPKVIFPNGVDAYGMAIVPSGYGDGARLMDYFGKRGAYWTYTMSHVTDIYVKRFDYNKAGVMQSIEAPSDVFSLRLVKDYDGSNHQDVEFINGINYKTVLMPSLNSKHGYAIWTATNVAFKNDRYKPIEPNNGIGVLYDKVYYINEWDGFDWVRKQLVEGDKITLIHGLDGKKDVEYQVVNGELVSTSDLIYNRVINVVNEKLTEIGDNIDAIEDRLDVAESNISSLEGKQEETSNKLEQEIVDRESSYHELKAKIEEETANRETADQDLSDEIENEASRREQEDQRIMEVIYALSGETSSNIDDVISRINAEKEARISADNELKELIFDENEERVAADKNLQDAIDSEAVTRENADNTLQENIDLESGVRKEADDKLASDIKTVNDNLVEAVNTINKNVFDGFTEINKSIAQTNETLLAEIEQRKESDKELNDRIDSISESSEQGFADLTSKIEEEAAKRQEADELLQSNIDAEAERAKEAEQALKESIDSEAQRAKDAETALDEKVDAETERAKSEESRIESKFDEEIVKLNQTDEEIKGKLISKEGHTFDNVNGVLTLRTENGEAIEIALNSNYGTF